MTDRTDDFVREKLAHAHQLLVLIDLGRGTTVVADFSARHTHKSDGLISAAVYSELL